MPITNNSGRKVDIAVAINIFDCVSLECFSKREEKQTLNPRQVSEGAQKKTEMKGN